MKIGFFGDSFCSDIQNNCSISNGYETYIEKLSKNLNAKIVHVGVGGSSIWDCILLQFQESVKKEIPDICIFVWTAPYRLFHREYRNLNFSSIENSNLKKSNFNLYTASLNYFQHLFDAEKNNIEHVSLLHYFDKKILSKYTNTKFIHLWSFKDSIIYKWETGVEIRPALTEIISSTSDDVPREDKTANHLKGEKKNDFLYTTIINAINEYQNGKIITFNAEGINDD